MINRLFGVPVDELMGLERIAKGSEHCVSDTE